MEMEQDRLVEAREEEEVWAEAEAVDVAEWEVIDQAQVPLVFASVQAVARRCRIK